MKTSTITAIAHALPAASLTQAELEARFGVKELASITRMSGIKNRRVVAPGQTAADLAFAAAQRLLAQVTNSHCEQWTVDGRRSNNSTVQRLNGPTPPPIDLLLFTSQTPDYRIPATASVLHGRLGLPERCACMDINQACGSFLHALAVAHSMLVAGTATRALVLNGDALSTLIHPRDRGLATLHGDGGTATLLDVADSATGGLEQIELCSDGTKFNKLYVPAGGARQPCSAETKLETTDANGCVHTAEHLVMDGPAIFHFCVYKVTAFLKEFLTRHNLAVTDFDTILLHQANKTLLDLIYQSIGAKPEQRFYYLEDVGNCSGASLPMTLAQAWREGRIKPGSRTLLCAFGGGLAWGAAVIRWPQDANAAVPGIVDVG